VEFILAVIWVRTVKPSHFPAIISQAYDDDDEVGGGSVVLRPIFPICS